MNILLVYPDDFTNTTTVTIDGRRFDHLTKILKIDKEQTIDVGLLNGKRGRGKIIEIFKKTLTLSIELNQQPPAESPITLILALPRPLMMKRILQAVTAMGVKQIHLINSQRVEKSYWGSSDMSDDVIYHQLILGLEQSRDTMLPSIHCHKNFMRFVNDEIPTLIKNKQALLAHLGSYPSCPVNVQQHTVLAVGPEGGFIPDEVKQMINAGFQPVQIGERPLRVESAVIALLGRLQPL